MGAIEHGTAGGDIRLATVQVEATDLAEEDLAPHAEATAGGSTVAGLDEAGNHLELGPEGRAEFGPAGRRGDLKGSRSRERRIPELLGRGRINGGLDGGV